MHKRSRLRAWLIAGLVAIPVASVRGDAGDIRLVQAAERHDSAMVQRLIRDGANVNVRAGDGSTALLWAAYWSDLDMARALVGARADVRIANRLEVTPLVEASRKGDAAMLDLLLKAGADPKTLGPEGETTLMAAAGAGSVEAVRTLLARGVDVNAKETWQGQTALMWAAAEGYAPVVEQLIKAGADLNIVAKPSGLAHRPSAFRGRSYVDFVTGGLTAVMFAAREGHTDVVKALADAGADLSHANPDGATALLIAVINDRYDLAGLLIDKGANADDGSLYYAVDMHNMTAGTTIGEATRPRLEHRNTLTSLDLIKRLLDHGARPNQPFTHTLHFLQTRAPAAPNNSPFYRAAQAGDVEAVRLMLAHGANPNLIVDLQQTTGGDGQPAVAVNTQTPLMAALAGGGGGRGGGGGGRGGGPQFREPGVRDAVETVKAMIAGGVDVNATIASGDTALHRMAQAGNVQMIQLLADAGAKLDVKNKAGLTPLDVAMGKQAPAAPARGGGGGGFGRGGPTGGPQPRAVVLLRQLMGLPPLAPDDPALAAPPAPRGRG